MQDSLPAHGATETPVDFARTAQRPSGSVRVVAGLILCVCVAVLGVALWLTPDPRGFGTHLQLGMGGCGMILTTGLPCPTCGMTTAFAHTVRGQLFAALVAQPGGLVLALLTIALVPFCMMALRRGRWPLRGALARVPPHRLFVVLLLVLLGGWATKLVMGLVTHTLPITHPIRVS